MESHRRPPSPPLAVKKKRISIKDFFHKFECEEEELQQMENVTQRLEEAQPTKQLVEQALTVMDNVSKSIALHDSDGSTTESLSIEPRRKAPQAHAQRRNALWARRHSKFMAQSHQKQILDWFKAVDKDRDRPKLPLEDIHHPSFSPRNRSIPRLLRYSEGCGRSFNHQKLHYLRQSRHSNIYLPVSFFSLRLSSTPHTIGQQTASAMKGEYDGQVQIRNFDEHLVELKELSTCEDARKLYFCDLHGNGSNDAMCGWDLSGRENGRPIRKEAPSLLPSSTPDCRLLATPVLHMRKVVCSTPPNPHVRSVVWNAADENEVVCASRWGRTVHVINLARSSLEWEKFTDNKGSGSSNQVITHKRHRYNLLAACEDGIIRLFDRRCSSAPVKRVRQYAVDDRNVDAITSICIDGDHLLYSGTKSGHVLLYDLRDQTRLIKRMRPPSYKTGNAIRKLLLHPTLPNHLIVGRASGCSVVDFVDLNEPVRYVSDVHDMSVTSDETLITLGQGKLCLRDVSGRNVEEHARYRGSRPIPLRDVGLEFTSISCHPELPFAVGGLSSLQSGVVLSLSASAETWSEGDE